MQVFDGLGSGSISQEALAKDAGFDVSKADWLRHQAKQTLELSDEELEGVSGGKDAPTSWCGVDWCGEP